MGFEAKSADVASYPNRDAWTSGSRVITTSGVAERLDDIVIPDGFGVTVRGDPDNNGFLYLGASQADAQLHKIPLGPDDCYTLYVTNVNKIWVDAEYSGEIILWVLEQ